MTTDKELLDRLWAMLREVEELDFVETAKQAVQLYVEENEPLVNPPDADTAGIPGFEVNVTWFCKTLQNWKAMLVTTLDDGMFYEVTYNGDKSTMYLDAYKKMKNVETKIDGLW